MKKFKSGFTMTELIIVLVIMGVLAYITFNKLFGAKTKQEIENAIKADMEVITAAADKFRLNNRDGRYTGLTVSKIAGSFPTNMKQMNNAATPVLGTLAGSFEWVGSLSFGEMCRYTVASNAADSNRTFNIYMNCSQAKAGLGWNDTEASLTEQVFWEFVNRKYGYSAGKGVVDASIAKANLSAPDAAGAGGIGGENLATDTPPTSNDNDGFALATDLRGF